MFLELGLGPMVGVFLVLVFFFFFFFASLGGLLFCVYPARSCFLVFLFLLRVLFIAHLMPSCAMLRAFCIRFLSINIGRGSLVAA